jgi:hypothetical protein
VKIRAAVPIEDDDAPGDRSSDCQMSSSDG